MTQCMWHGNMTCNCNDGQKKTVRQSDGLKVGDVLTNGHPEHCGCITYHRPTDTDTDTATCWYCIHGEHDKCTAHMHGNPADRCPRQVIRDPGNYVGVHRLSYSWRGNFIGRTYFRCNVGMTARR